MAAGDWHEFPDGYRFRETVHGPLVWGNCVDCGHQVAEVQPTGRINQWGLEEDAGATAVSRCSGCARKHYGLDD